MNIIILIGIVMCVTAQSSSMNVPSVLLPFPTRYHSVDYTIKATNGCFKWTTSHPNIISLTPLNVTCIDKDICSTECLIKVHDVDKRERQRVLVYATDSQTNVNLRTEVTIDSIAHIQIVSTTRLMNKDDYEVFEIDGFDSIGNKFSTLEGIPVTWAIESVNGTKGANGDYIKIEQFSRVGKTLKIDTSQGIVEMERDNLHTSKVLVQGLELGKAKLTARLLLDQSKSSSLVITVLQVLGVLPDTDMYVLEGTNILYKVYTTKRNEIVNQIPMPNSNYKWQTTDPTIGTVQNTGLVTTHKIGSTEVSVMYVETPESIQTRSIHVVKPYAVRLNWKEIRGQWQWIHKKEYEVTPELIDKNGNTISYVENAEYEITVGKGLKIVSYEKGYKKFIVQAIAIGKTSISAKFLRCSNTKIRETIKGSQDVIVSSPVIASPHIFRLSVPGTGGCKITATGGSNEYTYTLEGESIGITTEGVVFPNKVGYAKVIVSDARNADNFDIVEVEALEAVSIGVSEDKLEAQVGGSLEFTTVVKDSEGHILDQCSVGSAQWRVVNPEIFELAESSTPTKVAKITALQAGSTSLIADYGRATAEVQIHAFDPLSIHYDKKQNPHLAKSSGFIVSYEGGPKPWALNPQLYFTTVSESTLAVIQRHENNKLLVICKEYGKGAVTITVGNKAGKTHNYTITSQATMDFTCSVPDVLVLSTNDDYENEHIGKKTKSSSVPNICRERTVNSAKNGAKNQMTVRAGTSVEMVGYVKPSMTGLFTNSSSVEYVWSVGDTRLVSISKQSDKDDHSLVTIHIGELTGQVELKLTAIQYQRKYFKEIELSTKRLQTKDTLIRTITLNIVENVVVEPEKITIFNHPQNFALITASSGSGFFSFTTDSIRTIELEHTEYSNNCIVRPRNESINNIEVHDVCFDGAGERKHVVLTVSDVHEVTINLIDQIQLGDTTELTFNALDVNGLPFTKDQYKYMDIRVITDNSNIHTEMKEHTKYTVTTSSLGTTSVYVVINGVVSKKVNIIVYPEFTCTPQDINLIPLAQEVIKCQGGPPLHSVIEHKIISGNSIVLSGDKITGSVKGVSKIESRISIQRGGSSQKIVKGTSQCTVTVRHLTGLRMEAHQTTLEVGGQTKIRVLGEADGVIVSIAATQLDFMWSQTDALVTDIFSVYKRSNFSINSELSHTGLIVAKKSGSTRIMVKIENIQNGLPTQYMDLKASIVINVIDPFTSLCAGNCRNVIDIPIHSTTLIKTNKDPSLLDFTLCNGNHIIDVDRKGMITSYGKSGSAVVYVREFETGDILSYVVKVHSISAIELIPENTMRNGIAIGETMRFKLITIGDRGRVLSPLYDKLVEFELFPSGSVSVVQTPELSYVDVTAVKSGKAIIRVKGIEGIHLHDEVRLTIHHSVTPLNPIVLVGSSISFKTTSSSKWRSESKTIIDVESDGEAVAKSHGRAIVTTVSSTPAQTLAVVASLDSISLESKVVGSGLVLIPITFHAGSLEITQHEDIKLNIVGKCSVEESHWAQAKLEIRGGKYYCAVSPVLSTSAHPPQFITLKLTAREQTGKSVTTAQQLPFKAGLVARPGSLKMRPGKDAKLELFRVNGNVAINDRDGMLRITLESAEEGTAVYTINALQASKGYIEISDDEDSIRVYYEASDSFEKKTQKRKKGGNIVVSIFIILVVLFSCVFIYQKLTTADREYRPYQPVRH